MVKKNSETSTKAEKGNIDFILFALKQTHEAIAFGFTKNESRRNLKTALDQYWQNKEMRLSGINQKDKIPKSISAQEDHGKTNVEHAVPIKVIIDLLLELEAPNKHNVRDILQKLYRVCRVTEEEHKKLRDVGLRYEMPADWNKSDPFARYKVAGIFVNYEDFPSPATDS
ncbi:MAG: hypothetical protein GWP36_01065 [Bacteroidetes bacterium]|nr:hypothetical protein [Bacteroidota bacterium]